MGISKHRLLRLLRESLGLKQSEVAEELQISACYLSLLESGKKELTPQLLDALCERYNVPSHLFVWNEKDLERTATTQERSLMEKMNEYMDELLLLIMKRNAQNEAHPSL